MELCDFCGKLFKYILNGGGDIDSGYYCSDKCKNKLFDLNYLDEENEQDEIIR